MNAKNILNFVDYKLLKNATKQELIQMVLALHAELEAVKTEGKIRLSVLQDELALKEIELEKLT
jgi:hypothetical protein